MGRLKRMTEEEYLELKKSLEKAEERYRKAKEIRDTIKKRVRWYEGSLGRSMSYKKSKAYKMFGKRLKDLTSEEFKEYNRICTRESRERMRGED